MFTTALPVGMKFFVFPSGFPPFCSGLQRLDRPEESNDPSVWNERKEDLVSIRSLQGMIDGEGCAEV
jgi:hypothetical protein